ncbi:hypothetical protein FDZ84_17415 [Saccharopolyspora sp. ASAGF58]|nr:hypothetical protein FDZ84_17415 [Saccharopolyspora sp. ASAGF58]
MSGKRQSYDPYALIRDVEALLVERGLWPEHVTLPDEPGLRVQGACMLLRGLGIEPLMRYEDAIDENHSAYNRRIHGD